MTNNDTYHVPEGFDPLYSIDAIRGLIDAVHHNQTEGPGADDQMERSDKASLNALIRMLREKVYTLHEYLHAIDNHTTLQLPKNNAEFEALHIRNADKEVKDDAGLYVVS